jgi:hypothetical protein
MKVTVFSGEIWNAGVLLYAYHTATPTFTPTQGQVFESHTESLPCNSQYSLAHSGTASAFRTSSSLTMALLVNRCGPTSTAIKIAAATDSDLWPILRIKIDRSLS